MQKLFAQLGIINWKTTLTGITALITAVGVIWNALRTKDFGTVFTQAQTVIPIILLILAGINGLVSKDSNVTGAGTETKAVDASGAVIDVSGNKVGQQ